MSGNGKECKFERAFKTNMQPNKMRNINAVVPKESYGQFGSVNNVSGVALPKRMNPDDDKRRKEKNENLLHLICWGPN
ncbi:hypothetical protein TIFTF001_032553 [Ficus carica]|uniref:Uncharacterized protein n=1 Tax=Ficus carica TaxID=3494 RepID=A0AA88J831_FICCA|nr:hypothetical protein TIFTF001_032553 [Ficus carica]